MILRNLVKTVCIQGPVHISVWAWSDDKRDDIEVYAKDIQNADNLASEDLQKLFSHRVKYMFASEDGVLHIELVSTGY